MSVDISSDKPFYNLSIGNEKRVLLKRGKASITTNNKSYHSDCDIYLNLFPSSGIIFHAVFKNVKNKYDILNVNDNNDLSFFFNKKNIAGFATRIKLNPSGDLEIFWCHQREGIEIHGSDRSKINNIKFHIFNCDELVLPININFQDWNISIKSAFGRKINIETLKEKGGYQLTHIGELKKKNDSNFTGEEAKSILNSLKYCLSFSIGKWIDPILLVGHSKTKKLVWESLSSPRHTWYDPFSWTPRYHRAECIEQLYPKFMELYYRDENWQECFNEVIYWYLNANDGRRGIDAGIILIQTAIERLSFEFVVKDRKLLTADGFKDLRASDKFRILFSSLKIPLDIPKDCISFLKHPKINEWKNSPYALTEIRNSLVHPEHKSRGKLDDLYVEAWALSLWYLEMSILAICGYDKVYDSRLSIGENYNIKTVPWA